MANNIWTNTYTGVKSCRYKPSTYPKTRSVYEAGDGENKLLGLEIELELSQDLEEDPQKGNEAWRQILPLPYDNFPRRCYWKTDGSIRGYELVLAPATLEAWYDSDLDKMLRDIQALGGRAYEGSRCGLHVHCDRRGYGIPCPERRSAPSDREVSIARYIVSTTRLWQLIGKRRVYEYCALHGDYSYFFASRYQALNFQPRHTVEFRIFRGTTNGERVLASIAFADAFLRWTKQRHDAGQEASIPHDDINRFLEFVYADSAYDPLTTWLKTQQDALEGLLRDIREINLIA